MSWHRCPECGGQTEKDNEPCKRCCDRHRDTIEIVDTICLYGEQKAFKQSADRFDSYRGRPGTIPSVE